MTDNVEIEQSIEKPDLDNLEPWLQKYITEPFKGMEDSTRPDGTPFTKEDALEATKQQLRNHVEERHATLEMHNQIRPLKGLSPITPQENDQEMIDTLIYVAASMKSD